MKYKIIVSNTYNGKIRSLDVAFLIIVIQILLVRSQFLWVQQI